MKEILKLTLSLTLICAIAGACLAYVSATTAAPRKEAAIRQRNAKMMLVLPAETTSTAEDGTVNGVVFFKALNDAGKTIAYCAQGSDKNGFGGEVKVLVGIDLDGKVTGVLVSENSETPGIGSRVCQRSVPQSLWDVLSGKKPQEIKLPPNRYLDSYNKQSLSPSGFTFGDAPGVGKIVKESGATISSTAVLKAMSSVCAAWTQKHTAGTEAK